MGEPTGRIDGPPDNDDPFFAFYRAHVVTLYRWVHQRCRDEARAEDIVQETFFEAARADELPTEAWLYVVARNRLIDVVRRAARYDDRVHLVAGESNTPPPDEELLDRLELIAALESVSPHYRVALQLKYVDGLSVEALAAEIERSPKATESLLTRARAALSDALEDRDV